MGRHGAGSGRGRRLRSRRMRRGRRRAGRGRRGAGNRVPRQDDLAGSMVGVDAAALPPAQDPPPPPPPPVCLAGSTAAISTAWDGLSVAPQAPVLNDSACTNGCGPPPPPPQYPPPPPPPPPSSPKNADCAGSCGNPAVLAPAPPRPGEPACPGFAAVGAPPLLEPAGLPAAPPEPGASDPSAPPASALPPAAPPFTVAAWLSSVPMSEPPPPPPPPATTRREASEPAPSAWPHSRTSLAPPPPPAPQLRSFAAGRLLFSAELPSPPPFQPPTHDTASSSRSTISGRSAGRIGFISVAAHLDVEDRAGGDISPWR